MNKEELEKTMCLDEDSKNEIEEKQDIYEEYDNLFREKKYSDIQESLDAMDSDLVDAIVDENGDVIEEFDNIEESVVEETNEMEETFEEFEDIVKKGRWKRLSKKSKIFIIVGIVLFIILIALLIFLIFFKKDKKEDVKAPVEDIIVMKDNYMYKNGSLYFLDKDDKELGSYTCVNQDENKCYVAYNSKYIDNVNRAINVYEDNTQVMERLDIYFDRYAFVIDSTLETPLIVLYDFINGKELGKYKNVKTYTVNDRNYMSVLLENGYYNLFEITESGIVATISNAYKDLSVIESKTNNYVIGKLSTGYYLLDYTGKEISKLINNNIFDYNDKYIVTKDEKGYSLYDYENHQNLTGYKFIALTDDYIVLVDDNNKLYLRDLDLVKMNEEGIELNNEEFVTKNIFSSEKVRIKTLNSYQVTTSDNNKIIAVSNKDQSAFEHYMINLDEYNYNKTLNYYSYIDGKLYFYEDLEKEKLLGSYTCTNKNDSFVDGELLSNCRPALDTIYEENDMTYDLTRVSMIPLYNKRFVFVSDSTESNKTIKLIDLASDSKVLGTYESVNTYTTNNNGIFNVASIGSVNVICKSKKTSKYGMINVGSETVSPVYPFNYGYMEMLNGKVLALNESNKWQIIYNKTSSSYEFDGKIRGYVGNITYVKVKQNNLYYVYDIDGNKINNTGYKYVELYSSLYAGVDNDNNLMLYNYEGEALLEESEKIKLNSTEYYGVESVSFMVAVSGKKAIIEVYTNGEYVSHERTLKDPKQDVPKEEPKDEESIEEDKPLVEEEKKEENIAE